MPKMDGSIYTRGSVGAKLKTIENLGTERKREDKINKIKQCEKEKGREAETT